ncbi:hypothetical protein ACFQY0_14945 [Haloferula chungangensis]|uniref:Uncharacterized protein n=1 Tax=Haloferula chungangensis TaxID=1048331 RepID=A0ABW2LBE3_9BACT
MTTTRYLFARVAQAFGIQLRQRRMAEAASESHLLREAEQILGERIWENVEGVEELGVEYWNLRRLSSERDRLLKKLKEFEEVLTEAHDQRASVLGEKTTAQTQLEEQRQKLVIELEGLARERDKIVNKARDIRRLYDGLKTKLEVLKEESREDADVLERTQLRMTDLRKQFEDLKEERDKIAEEIGRRDSGFAEIDKKLEVERNRHREEASVAFQQIGDANRAISEFKAELGLIDTRMKQLFGEIGRHISHHAAHNPQCRSASQNQRAMIEVMSQLRKSISLNHKLSGN